MIRAEAYLNLSDKVLPQKSKDINSFLESQTGISSDQWRNYAKKELSPIMMAKVEIAMLRQFVSHLLDIGLIIDGEEVQKAMDLTR